MHQRATAVILLLLSLCSAAAAGEAIQVAKLRDSVVDPAALTIVGGFGQCINGLSFQQDAVTSHAGWQYVGYYDAKRRVCLARRKLPDGGWQSLRFPDYDFRSDDAHNTISLGLCPQNGTIHLAFDHHGNALHYRVSRRGVATEPHKTAWEPALFGPVISELEKGKRLPSVTYPRFWRTPDGGLQFCYRIDGSGNGDRMLVDYSAENGTWQHTRKIDSRTGSFQDRFSTSPSRCSYPNGYSYDAQGRLHVTWVWRERTQGANHDLQYAYSEDRGNTWRNNQGQLVGDNLTPGRVICLDTPGITVVPIGREQYLMNTHGQAVDSRGRIHTVVWHATEASLAQAQNPKQGQFGPADARRYHHYWRGDDGTWHHTELPGVAGNRAKLFFDKQDNALLIFNGRQPAGKLDSRSVYFDQGRLIIMAATAATQWSDWQPIHAERGPFMNEMLGDPYRWQDEGVLSVLVQESPAKPRDPTALRIIDFAFDRK